MKHKVTITVIILCMFLVAQFIGLYIISLDSVPPFLSANPSTEIQQSPAFYFYQIISSFIIAILIVVLITKYKLKWFMRIWFVLVVILAISVSLTAIFKNWFGITAYIVPLAIAIILGILKLFRPSMIIHNGTELLIYPGIAAIFVPILTPIYAIILLIIISIYDIWAVWHSGIMQKMAKFQMNELKIFGGFLIPYMPKEMKKKIQLLKLKYKNKNIPEKEIRKKGIKISMAILGGGDIVFPIITAGVFMLAYGLAPAIAIIFGAFIGLLYLLIFSEKRKFYPAMPFITTGIFIGLAIWWLTRLI
jgi:presenilin-like A22 family membrane protease